MAVRVSAKKDDNDFWGGIGGFFNDIIRNMNRPGSAPSLSVPTAFVPPHMRKTSDPLTRVVGNDSARAASASARDRDRNRGFDMERDRRASADARRRNMNRMHEQDRQEQQDEMPAGFSFLDALKQAMGLIGGDGGGQIARVSYDPQRQEARNRASEADSRLAAMYRQLQDSYRADAPGIAAAYDQAAKGVNQNVDQAVGNINTAYDKAREDQTAQLAALGIEDAAAGIMERGEGSAPRQAEQVGNLEQNRGAVSNQIKTNRQSSLDYNKGIEGAAGLEGNLQRAQNQSALQQLLAQIDAEEQNQNAQIDAQNQSARGSSMNSAMGLAQALQEDYYRQHPELVPAQGPSAQEQQALAEFVYQQQQDANKAITSRQSAQRDQMNALMKMYGNDTQKAQEAYNWYVQNGLV